jgi:hypothetical protein
MDNIRAAHINGRKGKGHYIEVKMVDSDPDKYLGRIHRMLVNKTFRNSRYKIFIKHGIKDREIYKLPYFPDRIVQHAIMRVLEPIWERSLIRDTYSAIKGRGIHDGVSRMKTFLRDEYGTRYCLKMDVRHFYPSVDHDVMRMVVRKKIKCPGTLWLLDEIIGSAPGIPIGNYLSQYLGNLYLSGFDWWIKGTERVKYYARYCDDIVILHHDKSYLHELRKKCSEYLGRNLRLKIKDNWQVFPVKSRGIDFLGYRFFGQYTLIRKRIANDFKRKVRYIAYNYSELSHQKIVNRIMSYYGWLKHGNGYNLWMAHITPGIAQIVDDSCNKSGTHNPMEKI